MNEKRFIAYLNTKIGLIKVVANHQFLLECKIKKFKDENEVNNKITKLTIKELKMFLKSNLSKFTIPLKFDNTFSGKVYKNLFETKKGETITYKELGNKIQTKAYRAIGTILSKNPIAIIVPCHRVIKSNGTLGKYTIGKDIENTNIKKILLKIEQK